MITRDTIMERLGVARRTLERVPVPEWANGEPPEEACVWIKVMSGPEWDSFWDTLRGKEGEAGDQNASANLLVRVLCDKDGNRLFADNDAEALGEMEGYVLARLARVAMERNRMRKSDREEIEKNSGEAIASQSSD